MTGEVGKVFFKHHLLGLKKSRKFMHSEALSHVSSQLLSLLFKNPLVVFLSPNPLQSWAFMLIPRMWARECERAAALQSILVSPAQHTLSTKRDQDKYELTLSFKAALSSKREVSPSLWLYMVRSQLKYWSQHTNVVLDLHPGKWKVPERNTLLFHIRD